MCTKDKDKVIEAAREVAQTYCRVHGQDGTSGGEPHWAVCPTDMANLRDALAILDDPAKQDEKLGHAALEVVQKHMPVKYNCWTGLQQEIVGAALRVKLDDK